MGSLESLRDSNRSRVIDALRRRGSASRSDLARLTGLSRTTVTTLIADLQDRGLILEEPGDPARPETRQPRSAARASCASRPPRALRSASTSAIA